MSFFSDLFKKPDRSKADKRTGRDLSALQRQLMELSSQMASFNPNTYQMSDAERQILGDIGDTTSARFAGLGFGDSPFTGGQIASSIAPALMQFRDQAFKNQLAAFTERSNALNSAYQMLLGRKSQFDANKKKRWWEQPTQDFLSSFGTSLGKTASSPTSYVGGFTG